MDAAPITGLRIAASGFREYDARWRFPEDLDLAGVRLLGAALGTQMHEAGLRSEIVLGHDYRAYAPAVAGALGAGLAAAGDLPPASGPVRLLVYDGSGVHPSLVRASSDLPG